MGEKMSAREWLHENYNQHGDYSDLGDLVPTEALVNMLEAYAAHVRQQDAERIRELEKKERMAVAGVSTLTKVSRGFSKQIDALGLACDQLSKVYKEER